MNLNVTCPVCSFGRELPEGVEGKKWKCGQCGSIHRVQLGEGQYTLKTLEEVIYTPEPPREMAMAAESGVERGKKPVGPRLTTKRDKFKDEAPPAARRTTRGSSRRGRR